MHLSVSCGGSSDYNASYQLVILKISRLSTQDDSIVLMGGFTDHNDVWRSVGGSHWLQVSANAEWSGRAGHSAVALVVSSVGS